MPKSISMTLAFLAMVYAANGTMDFVGSDTALLDEVSARDILSKIEEGADVRYDHVRIIGDLVLSQSNKDPLAKQAKIDCISSSIVIVSSIMDGQVDFKGVHFNESVDFGQTRFTKEVEFGNAKFDKKANFTMAHFDEDASFDNAVFKGYAFFSESYFDDYIGFMNTKFDKTSYFDNAYFSKYANYLGANFTEYVNFNNAEFENSAMFENTTFGEVVEFSRSKFSENAFFSGSKFLNDARFRSMKFIGNAEYYGAYFYQDAIFIGSTFEKNAYFNEKPSLGFNDGARFCSDLDLTDTIIHSIQFDDAEFSGNISLNNSDFNRLIVDWSVIKDHMDDNNKEVYQALIKNFKEQDKFKDAEDCYYDYQFRFMSTGRDYLGLIIGFGVDWKNIFSLAAVLWFVFGIWYLIRNRRYWIDVSDAFLFSAIIFFSIPIDFFPRKKIQFATITGNNPIAMIIERIFGYALLVIFIGFASRLIIRY